MDQGKPLILLSRIALSDGGAKLNIVLQSPPAKLSLAQEIESAAIQEVLEISSCGRKSGSCVGVGYVGFVLVPEIRCSQVWNAYPG